MNTPSILAALFFGLSLSLLSADERRPNVIMIMADDMGYETVSANGCEDYQTPNIDAMAETGMRFTNAFANPICTPSRVKLMTGKSNVRNYTAFGVLDRDQKTFGHYFRDAGYKTCIAGKWQLGKQLDAPQHFGFDTACLWQHTTGNSHKIDGKSYDSRHTSPDLTINGEFKEFRDGEFGPDVCVDFIEEFMTGHKDDPFFVYYPMILPHCPFIPTPGTPDYDPTSLGSPTYKGDPKYFKAMVEHVDLLIGRIVAKVEELGLTENTMIVFTGDNGTDAPVVTKWNGQEIKAGKGKAHHDSGVRTPFFATMPGTIQSGVVSDDLVDFSDLLPTFCELSGIDSSADPYLDGVSLMPTFTGKGQRKKPWSYLFYSRNDGSEKASSVVVRSKTHLVIRVGGPENEVECYGSSTPYARTLLEEEKQSEEDQKAFAKLKKVMKNYDAAFQSDLSEKTIAAWSAKQAKKKQKKK